MRVSFRSIVIHVVLACPVALVFAGCSGTVPSSTSVVSGGTQVDVSPSGPIGNSPNTAAAQGVAINGNQSAYVSSNNWLAAYNANWTLQWKNTNELAGLPSAVTHIGDIDYYNGKLIAPVENYTGCNAFAPVLLAVYDAATGSLVTWSDITANGHEASSVTVIAEKNQLVVSDFCSQVSGRNKLWIYDLNAVLNNPAGSVLSAIGSIQLTPPLSVIQGISWNANVGQYLATADISGSAGSLWYIAPDGTVTGPAYVVPGTGELEGADFSTGNIYYLLNGYVYSAGTPVSAPTFSVASGTYTSAQTVTISDTTPNAVIRYTLDGSMPTAASSVYSAPLAISRTTSLKAIAGIDGSVNSPMTGATYTMQ
jgi:hypothetical protein